MSHDKTPGWGRLSYPAHILSSDDFPVTIFYKGISPPAQLSISIVYRDEEKKYNGRHQYAENSRRISGTGQEAILLSSFVPETVAQIRIKIGLYEIPDNKKVSNVSTKRRLPFLVSSWIPVFHNDLPIKKDNQTISYILSKGYRTGYWKEHRGDYSLAGWTITIAYAACFISFVSLLMKTPFPNSLDKIFWITVGGILLLLTINKQMDLQMLLTDIARTAAKEYHVYEIRKPFQLKIISLFASLGLTSIISLLFLFRKTHKSLLLASAGVSILFLFLILRLVSQHWLDAVLTQKVLIFSFFDLLELSGITAVFLSICWYHTSHTLRSLTERRQ